MGAMELTKEMFQKEKLTLEGRTIEYRAARNIIYVKYPVNPEYQNMNLFVPEAYYHDASVNGYTKDMAPIFMSNEVGGYLAGQAGEPGYSRFRTEEANTIFQALEHGYVVAAPAIRGRELKDSEGRYTGKAPACIVDYKAAVRFLRCYHDAMPGDVNKIITNGTSAGGALSALMGVTGNQEDYEEYLKKIGAAEAEDHIFAASCYCPITNLEHADMAYEWQFSNGPAESSVELAENFPDYVNSLDLRDEKGEKLTLDENGNGSFKKALESVLLSSAQTALDNGVDIFSQPWLTVEGQHVVGVDFSEYAKYITRMKPTPAFDDFHLQTPENDLFGTEEGKGRHFTEYSVKTCGDEGGMADKHIVKMMNPMSYLSDIDMSDADPSDADSVDADLVDANSVDADPSDTGRVNTNICRYWRIRHGEHDWDPSAAISAILAIKLRQSGCQVDYALPWGIPHSGDYDLQELFAWIDGICMATVNR